MCEILVMSSGIKRFFLYILRKRSEIKDLDVKDITLTKVILDIHRKRTGKRFIFVPLFDVKPVHALDRDNSPLTSKKRAGVLRAHREGILAAGRIDRALLADLLPSASWIKVVREDESSYIAFEGNGRLSAMQEVFVPADGVDLKVEEYIFRNTDKIIRHMNLVRRMNGLEK